MTPIYNNHTLTVFQRIESAVGRSRIDLRNSAVYAGMMPRRQGQTYLETRLKEIFVLRVRVGLDPDLTIEDLNDVRWRYLVNYILDHKSNYADW